MEEPGKLPDILAYHFAEADSILQQLGLTLRIVYTSPHGDRGHGPQRVVRQRMDVSGTILELTVAAEDWGKEV